MYVGQHATDNKNDGYMGSGALLFKAIKKYGKENFETFILNECSSFEEMNELEKKWVDLEWCSDQRNYNLREGGNDGRMTQVNCKGQPKGTIPWNKGMKTGPQTQETIEKRRNSLIKRGPFKRNTDFFKSEEYKMRQSENMKRVWAERKLAGGASLRG